MNQQLKTEIHATLQRNAGNRLTDDLIVGLSVRLLTLFEKAVFEASKAAQADQEEEGADDGI